MQYYVAWTNSDPIYQHYLPYVRVLVSPPNVSRSWRARDWPSLPSSLMIDSGAYQPAQKAPWLTPLRVWERQCEMIMSLTIPIRLCHLDVPLFGAKTLGELERRVVHNLENARWLISRLATISLPANVQIVGVIQGYDVSTIYNAARVLADMGYSSFALGSLARLVTANRDEFYRRVEAALEAVGANLHIFGVSSVEVLTKLARLGVASADSSAPAQEAWRGGLFYSNPLRRYKLASPHFSEWRRNYTFAEILTQPLPCDCPVCREDSSRLLNPEGKSYVRLRAIHNCYHLYQELAAIASDNDPA
ncbi:MAG: hypothetical protein RMJ55_07130 [Roseiflexaceae bacterium]|nr:queuine tRNA-ribosyltransferase family protein [Roseiflexus sp.]MCS7288240.1 queuine tRNA-ribosyltransferase family protein [Roseiflexus sp.]MDW8213311.1 hypothetical protein [Roseiflexaceae bacterium]